MFNQLTDHFQRSEFACKCGCGFDTVDTSTLMVLHSLRQHFGAPVIINSGCRCPAYNKSIGGVPDSQHVLVRAADILVAGVDPIEVHDWLETRFPNASLGLYPSFVHVDTRSGGPARW